MYNTRDESQTRKAMGDQAAKLAKAVKYSSTGETNLIISLTMEQIYLY